MDDTQLVCPLCTSNVYFIRVMVWLTGQKVMFVTSLPIMSLRVGRHPM